MNSWSELLESELVTNITERVAVERLQYNILPGGDDMFNAFHYTPFNNVKVVILGQDPYHTRGFAHGLSFSVPPDVIIPKSLINIYKELEDDLGIKRTHGCLIDWAQQGVLLLNTALTVREGVAGSHSNIGWKKFTDLVISTISKENDNIVFILWGNPAISKRKFIDEQKHHIITSAHPSPLSAHKGFFGSKPFSHTNSYLAECNIPIINW